MKEKASSSNKSLKSATIFACIVFVLIAISLGYRAWVTWQESTFDGTNRYTLLLLDQKSQKERLLSFDPEKKQITTISLPVAKEGRNTPAVLGVLVDGTVKKRNIPLNGTPSSVLSQLVLQDSLLRKENVSFFDLIGLYLLSLSVPKEEIHEVTLAPKQTESSIDTALQGLFQDEGILGDEKTIGIVNAADYPGVGHRVERALLNAGANVVSVTNSREATGSSSIRYTDDLSYTAKKLGQTLAIPVIADTQQSVGDIMVIIGTDKAKSLLE